MPIGLALRRMPAVLLAVSALAIATTPARAATTDLEAETLTLPAANGQVFSDGSASAGKGLLIWSNGTASGSVTTSGAKSISIRAKGDQCAGAPQMTVTIDGKTAVSGPVASSSWASYGANLDLSDGPHTLAISFTNDYAGGGCDRNLRVDSISFSATAGFEGESMSLPSSNGQVFSDGAASGGKGLLIWSNGSATESYATTGIGGLTVRAKGDQCAGAPQMAVAVDGTTVLTQAVSSTSWTDYTAKTAIADGPHTVTIAFTNDYSNATCDRNLRVDSVALLSKPSGSPFAGAKLYMDPNSNAKRQADSWRQSRPADAAQMDKIAAQSQADWFGDWNGDIRSAVDQRVSTITAAGALPVLVAYDIPVRDCSSYSNGGATSPDAYKTWIRAFASGIGSRKAAVILEPDALAGMDCLTAADQQTRLTLLKDAANVLAALPATSVYIDAGNENWHSATDTASRLKSAGIDQATGFSLNVSNFLGTGGERSYGAQVSSLTGGKHFVVDTSRNGLGGNGEWCNPAGRALGDRPTAQTGDPLADAYLWIKQPGESDGTCNGGPPAGQWWAEYALGLAQRASY